jgi:dipeptidyl aminopeptidase/acylaminoacyl peptidase
MLVAIALFASLLLAGEPTTAHPHGTKTDYERAASLGRQFQGKVFKAVVHPHWFADHNRFWYRNDVAGGREFIVVDAVAGKREPAFDYARLSAAFDKALGKRADAPRLLVERIAFPEKERAVDFWASGSWWRCPLDTYDVRPLKADERPAPTLPALRSPHPSQGKGGETNIQFTNKTAAPVELQWVDLEGKRKAYGTLGPGETRAQHTFAGHVWAAVSKDGKVLAAFEATEEPGLALIAEPKTAPTNNAPAIAALASRGQGPETNLRFLNRTRSAVDLFWVDAKGERKPFGRIEPDDDRWQHTFAGHVWIASEPGGRILAAFEATDAGGTAEIVEPKDAVEPREPRKIMGAPSPDGQWAAYLRNRNVFIRNVKSGAETALTTDGSDQDAYEGELLWSPDSRRLLAVRTEAGQEHKVYAVESSPKDQVQPKLQSWDYLKPGDKIARRRPYLFDIQGQRRIVIKEDLFANPWSLSELRWEPDGRRFTFLYNQRGHQVVRIVAVDAESGAASALIEEAPATFVDYSNKIFYRSFEKTAEILWMSERDGWNHLYLFDAKTGKLKSQITRGEWVVRGVDRVDEEKRQIWFHAGGIHPGQDPYYLHYARVNFDGSGLTILTEGDGTHHVEYSPDRRFLIDTWSRVDQPPVTELRRTGDGKRICELERADASALIAAGWRPPERFVAKGRDGTTDIYGVIHRPVRFDPKQKYPVIEAIYAGPHGYFVPKEFHAFHGAQEMAELGFIVVQIDGMGTNWRSRAFHDVSWKKVGDSGFPDRILWIKAAAEKYPEMDPTRVGIYGGSAGGQSALGALLTHGDFYHAAAADCGCHDNRMDKIWWNEAWMGWPIGPHYAEQSNVTLAHKLQGKLLLTVGELDHNVDPASTMQVVNALIKADKDFEFVIIPGADHGCGESPYGKRRRADFFVRNLLGVEPRKE